MVRTTIDIDDDLWRIVRIKANNENKTLMDSLEGILEDYIEDHGENYSYSIGKGKEKS